MNLTILKIVLVGKRKDFEQIFEIRFDNFELSDDKAA